MKPEITEIARLLQTDPELLLIYLFGSAASGTLHVLSDVDIGVLLFQDKIER